VARTAPADGSTGLIRENSCTGIASIFIATLLRAVRHQLRSGDDGFSNWDLRDLTCEDLRHPHNRVTLERLA
jgi:hypothetical protein